MLKVDQIGNALEALDQQDLYLVTRQGVPQDITDKIEIVCSEYRAASAGAKWGIRLAVSRRATVVLLSFAHRRATLAVQEKSTTALEQGLIALHLSNIIDIDFRDAFHPVGCFLAAGRECGVDASERAIEVLPDLSPRLANMFNQTPPWIITRDAGGNVAFQRPGTSKQHNR
jgi:hypothetical protein